MADTAARAAMRRLVRENRGRAVRNAWVEWASEQPDAGPSWLVPWDELDEDQREADMRIGDALMAGPLDLLASIADLLDAAPRLPLSIDDEEMTRIVALEHALSVIRGSIGAVLDGGVGLSSATAAIGQEIAKLRIDTLRGSAADSSHATRRPTC